MLNIDDHHGNIAGCDFLWAVGSPIQTLMTNTAEGTEMFGAAATQAAFNIGNVLGASLGGLPMAWRLGITSPEIPGVIMATTGTVFALTLSRQKGNVVAVHNFTYKPQTNPQ